MENKERIDILLTKLELARSRSQAKSLIENGNVLVNEKVITKPNFLVAETDNIVIKEKMKYVSRAGLKLEKGIESFGVDFTDKVVLDIGASTGGFTDCSLQHGAKQVYAVDVGYNQLDSSLVNNPKVINLEKTNVKNLNEINFEHHIDIIVCDVSFISLKHVFANIKSVTDENTNLIFLIKPQFELSPEIISKCKASVKNKKYHDIAINNVTTYALENGFKLIDIVESPIKGNKLENTEFVAWFKKWK
ncbi:TlyA family RNA methyltransferase [Ureaplasma ceti]|uniref:TlyA family rRNA (Cytidine-2'-O)-methyltransferase n=1 Tax=Ureaplasma ceti TaxID=3119530 RepID=A0ABP9U7U5_9BACT